MDTRLMYAEFLKSRFDVITAGDGWDALHMMRSGPRPDLVITDLSLPRLDGFGLIAAMREDDNLRGLPIICLSGYGGHAHEQRAKAAGSNRTLQKPCLPEALADAAAEMILEFRERGAG